MPANTMTILIVEDDDVDFWAIERALTDLKISNPIKRAHDGVEAFEILCSETENNDALQTSVILLDLNMPRIGGLDFLQRLRKDPQLSHIPVIVSTTSSRNEDIITAFKYDVCGYVVKTDLHEGLREAFEDMDMHKAFVIAA